jgi:predicted PurR-regulated permease PerM
VTFSPANVWRVGLVVLALIALGLMIRFVINDGGSVIFTVLMSWFAAIAMAPVVDRLSKHMRRGVATMLVMLTFAVAAVVFVVAFGSLLVDQLAQLIVRIPALIDGAFAWVNSHFNTSFSPDTVLASLGGGSKAPDFGGIASSIGSNVFGVLSTVLGSVFGLFTVGLFTFYFSADMPRFQTWIGRLFPPRSRGVVETVWRLTAQKTGGYVGARVVLGAINSITSGIVFFLVGLPYWLPLALWTGVVAQFVPTIGTYIAIVLPVLVGALSPKPWLGLVVLVWALLYQQVENLTIEPKISAKAVDVNPAVGFGAVLLGSALFGIAGAFLAVPVVAMLMSLFEVYGTRYELDDEGEAAPETGVAAAAP